jgi:hypothetical protein
VQHDQHRAGELTVHDFILYMTTPGGRIDLQAADAVAAVRSAIEQEEAAGTLAYGPDPYFRCPCGRSHRLSAEVGELIRTAGPLALVTTPDGSWQVPRVWIAVHGLKPHELPALARAHKWKQEARR